MAPKLCLVVVDSLRADMLRQAVASGSAPTFAKLLERGAMIDDCVSSFPSVTPVCCSDIVTGEGPAGHWVPGMNWYHRTEGRYVEYGSSLEATRTFGLFRTLYDTVYNMNMAHLSPEAETVFERLGDAGVRTACTPFLIYRGRRRHEVGLEGLMRRVAVAANFRHAVWGPDELFYGELYASRKVPCKPTLARPGTRDEYSACVSRELVREDLYDFLLFSLPDNDFHSHRLGPAEMESSIAHADRCFADLVEAAGGMDAFLEQHAVILMADHAQTAVSEPVPIAGALGAEWRVLQPNSDRAEAAELAVSPTARAAGVYLLVEGKRRLRAHAAVRGRLRELAGVDLVCWLAGEDGAAPERTGTGAPDPGRTEAVVERGALEVRFRPGTQLRDARGQGWDVEGDESLLDPGAYPDGYGRLWSALCSPQAGDVLVSLADGFECVDWGGSAHVGGGSHGSLLAEDSLVPLVTVGLEPAAAERESWAIRDVASLVLDHFGAGEQPRIERAATAEVAR
jgi:hypothetical protein